MGGARDLDGLAWRKRWGIFNIYQKKDANQLLDAHFRCCCKQFAQLNLVTLTKSARGCIIPNQVIRAA